MERTATEISRYWNWLVFLCLLVAAYVLYSASLQSDFHFDDYAYIVESKAIRDISYCLNSLWSNLLNPDYMLVTLTFAVNYFFHGLEPAGYYLFNIVLHAINSYIVFLLVKYLLNRYQSRASLQYWGNTLVPVTISGLFLVHPLAVNSVAYASQRHGLMASCFYLLGVYCFLQARDRKGRQALANYFMLLVCFWAAVHCKPMTLTLPLMLLVAEFVLVRGVGDTCSKQMILYGGGVLACLTLFVTYGVHKGLFSSDSALVGFVSSSLWSPWHHFLTESSVFLHYLKLILLPLPQWMSVDHVFPVVTRITPGVWLSWLFHAGIFLSGFVLLRKGCRVGAFGLAWFYTTLVPPYLVLPIQDVMVEYKTYLPCIGILITMGSVLAYGVRKPGRKVCLVATLVIFSLFIIVSYERKVAFKSENTLWTDVLKKYPENERAYNNRGLSYLKKGQYERARQDFEMALSLSPDYTPALSNLGDVYKEMEDFNKAKKYYSRYLNLQPDDPDGYQRLAVLYGKRGMWELAAVLYRKSWKLRPFDISVMYNLGLALGNSGEVLEAEKVLLELLSRKHDHVDSVATLGALYLQGGSNEKALRFLERSLEIQPDHMQALYNLCLYHIGSRNWSQATRVASRLVEVNPALGKRIMTEVARRRGE